MANNLLNMVNNLDQEGNTVNKVNRNMARVNSNMVKASSNMDNKRLMELVLVDMARADNLDSMVSIVRRVDSRKGRMVRQGLNRGHMARRQDSKVRRAEWTLGILLPCWVNVYRM
jgi:hypothetical protein